MENLKKLRKAHHLSQKQLAGYLNLSQQSIWKYENGIAEPDFQTLKGFSKLFHTSVDYLIGNIDDEKDYLQCDVATTENERMHLMLYRSASPEIQKSVDKLLLECSRPSKLDFE